MTLEKLFHPEFLKAKALELYDKAEMIHFGFSEVQERRILELLRQAMMWHGAEIKNCFESTAKSTLGCHSQRHDLRQDGEQEARGGEALNTPAPSASLDEIDRIFRRFDELHDELLEIWKPTYDCIYCEKKYPKPQPPFEIWEAYYCSLECREKHEAEKCDPEPSDVKKRDFISGKFMEEK